MKTDLITINSDLKGSDAAMQTAEKFSAYHGITGKNAMHLRLLTEETVSMIHGIFDDFSGSFWIESEGTKQGLLCRICLSAERQANQVQESQILSVSTSGRNESAKGVLGKIRELLRRSLQMPTDADEQYLKSMSDAWLDSGSAGTPSGDAAFWSLRLYRESLSSGQNAGKDEWDELEKSIIAKLADEVKVWLHRDSTTVMIEKIIRL